MTFLWSEIPFELSPSSVRYYNDMVWYIVQVYQLLPLFFIGFYKLYRVRKNPQTKENINPQTWDNKITLIMSLFSCPYYLIDLIVSIWEGTCFYPCRFALVYHHLISLVVVPVIISRRYFDWQDMFVLGSHSMLMYFPQIFWLNFVYVSFVIIFLLKLYTQEPLNQHWKNKFIRKYLPFVSFSFILMLQCEEGINGLPYLY